MEKEDDTVHQIEVEKEKPGKKGKKRPNVTEEERKQKNQPNVTEEERKQKNVLDEDVKNKIKKYNI